MASGLRSDETKPRRFDLTMSRRTRRPPPATTSATSCHEQHHQAVDVDVQGLGSFQPAAVQDPDALFCLSDHHHQKHEKKDDGSEAQPQQKKAAAAECQEDNSHRFSLQELIEDEAVDDAVNAKDTAATGGAEKNAGAGVGVGDVAEGGGGGAAAAGEEKRCPGQQQVAGRRRVIGMMRRYVKVRSIKPKRASPEKNAARPVC